MYTFNVSTFFLPIDLSEQKQQQSHQRAKQM